MACEFDIELKDDAEVFFEKAKKMGEEINGTFTGDAMGGTFDIKSPFGDVAGNYKTTGRTVHIVISHKPMLMPCSGIEGILKSKLG